MSSVSITIRNNNLTIRGDSGEILLDILRENDIFVPAPCGGSGKCRHCRVALIHADGSSEEILSCLYTVESDITIYIPEFEGDTYAPDTANIPQTDVISKNAGALGVGVDLGTTTVVASLLDLSSGDTLATISQWNKQGSCGGDVISRITYANTHENGLSTLTHIIRKQIADEIHLLLKDAGLFDPAINDITAISIAGNTIMQHIFAGIDPADIAVAPYKPKTLFKEDTLITYEEFPQAKVHLTPCIAGYVGGDITAGMLAASLDKKEGNYLFLDLGTNGEMALGGKSDFLCCSVATGPAFEGAEISCGMMGSPGAISHVRWDGSSYTYDVIGQSKPIGICGSGLIDLLAMLLHFGVVDETGRMLPPDDFMDEYNEDVFPTKDDARIFADTHITEDGNGNGCFYVTEDHSVYFTAGDVRKLQLAKASVAAGIEILISEKGIKKSDVSGTYIAGGFGDHLQLENAATIGMIPADLIPCAKTLGNTSLAGSITLVNEPESLGRILSMIDGCAYIELSTNKEFSDVYIENMAF